MRKTLLTLAVSLALAALIPTAANATLYSYDFESFDGTLSMTGDFTIDASSDVVTFTGVISGLVTQTISGVVANPSFPGSALSPDGSFVYDNLFYNSDPNFNSNGVLFTTVENTNGYWNLWGNSPGNYSLWESAGPGNYTIQETGKLSVTSIPELSTWAMLALGFGGLALARVRRGPRLADAIA